MATLTLEEGHNLPRHVSPISLELLLRRVVVVGTEFDDLERPLVVRVEQVRVAEDGGVDGPARRTRIKGVVESLVAQEIWCACVVAEAWGSYSFSFITFLHLLW